MNDPFAEIHTELNALRTLCLINEKIYQIKRANNRCDQYYRAASNKNEYSDKSYNAFCDIIEFIQKFSIASLSLTVQMAKAALEATLCCSTGRGK